jgi:hypothetical protein
MKKICSKCILKNHVDSTAVDSTLQWVSILLWPALIQNRQAIVQANCIVGLASPRLEVLKQHQKTCIIWCHTCQTQYNEENVNAKTQSFSIGKNFMYNRCLVTSESISYCSSSLTGIAHSKSTRDLGNLALVIQERTV